MDATRASLTALGASLMRAMHTRYDQPALIDDPWGDRLVREDERELLRQRIMANLTPEISQQLEKMASDEQLQMIARASSVYGNVIVRTRYAEDALEALVARGARQYVIIGAGMDSFGLRRPAFARNVRVFEVDHPASQEFKRRRLRECGVDEPDGLEFVACDLSQETLDAALARTQFRSRDLAFFSWLGVTAYLTREANLATLRAVSTCAAPGSDLVFTYIDQAVLDSGSPTPEAQSLRDTVEAMGEPWVSGFDPAELGGVLDSVELELVESLGRAELEERYCAGRSDTLPLGSYGHIALARVATNRQLRM